MKNHKSLQILQLLLKGCPVKLEGNTWYLGANNMLGVKLEHFVKGVKQPDNDEIHTAEWSLSHFINVCEKLTEVEICSIVEKDDESVLEIRANESLFNDGKQLGDQIGELLSNIVQNDVCIPEEELIEWIKKVQVKTHQIINHGEKTVSYIKSKLWPENKSSLKKTLDCYSEDDGMNVADNLF